jgi:tRNA(adenine34) deaminase
MPAPDCPFPKKFPSQLIRDDEFFMSLAFNQAIDAWRRDEVPIGCVIERDGVTQAAAAIGDWRLSDCTLYVTKEPCPMCSGAMVMARLKRVCYAVPDPKMGCLGGATNLNQLPRSNHRCELSPGGTLEAECRSMLQAFFQAKRQAADDLPSFKAPDSTPEI